MLLELYNVWMVLKWIEIKANFPVACAFPVLRQWWKLMIQDRHSMKIFISSHQTKKKTVVS